MKLTCSVVQDLLPLCQEQIASAETCAQVQKHLELCQDCRHQQAELCASLKTAAPVSDFPLQKLRTAMRRKKLKTSLLALMLSLALAVMILARLTTPAYLPRENIIRISTADDYILVHFSEKVSGYNITSYPADDGSASVLHLTPWDSVWNRSIIKNSLDTIILNPDGNPVAAVYYAPANGQEHTLIYGTDLYPTGGVIVLPRLFLSYYALLAAGLTLLGALVIFLNRHHPDRKLRIIPITLIPVSYLAGHWLIKGTITASYSATQDFYTILLAAAALYAALLSLKALLTD